MKHWELFHRWRSVTKSTVTNILIRKNTRLTSFLLIVSPLTCPFSLLSSHYIHSTDEKLKLRRVNWLIWAGKWQTWAPPQSWMPGLFIQHYGIGCNGSLHNLVCLNLGCCFPMGLVWFFFFHQCLCKINKQVLGSTCFEQHLLKN